MTSDVTVTSTLNSQQATSNSSAQLAEDFDDFLQLLTVQLQNQDPLDPMDSTEFTNQLVAFAGVEQQINTNQKLDDLVALGVGDSFSYALNYIGNDIKYLSSEAYYDGSTPVEINYAIEGTSEDTTINIYNEEGDLIYSENINSSSEIEEFTWNGTRSDGTTAEAGTYTIRVDALDSEGNSLETSTVITGHVSGVETQNGSTYLIVGERAVSIGSVINVSQPTTTSTDQTSDTTGSSDEET